jgi:hypothetical protein
MKKKPYQSSPLVTGTLTRSRTYIVVPRDVPPENFLTVSETRKVGQTEEKMGTDHKVHTGTYKEYHSVMSPRRNWDFPNPSLAIECAPFPGTGGGGTLACGLGVGGVPIPTTGENA